MPRPSGKPVLIWKVSAQRSWRLPTANSPTPPPTSPATTTKPRRIACPRESERDTGGLPSGEANGQGRRPLQQPRSPPYYTPRRPEVNATGEPRGVSPRLIEPELSGGSRPSARQRSGSCPPSKRTPFRTEEEKCRTEKETDNEDLVTECCGGSGPRARRNSQRRFGCTGQTGGLCPDGSPARAGGPPRLGETARPLPSPSVRPLSACPAPRLPSPPLSGTSGSARRTYGA